MLKKFITQNYGVIECEVDKMLQRKNLLVERGIYLVEVEDGIVWGYDIDRYEKVEESIVRKNFEGE